jgi:ribosomal protein S27AE
VEEKEMAKTGLKLIMRACPRCGGAAYLEDPRDEEWRCLQCARTVPNANIEALRRTTQLTTAA